MKQQILDENYWNERYNHNSAGWDVGEVSAPLKEYIDQLTDKSKRILIPGCGNAYEAAYLLDNGFTDITLIDISPTPVNTIRQKLHAYLGKELNVILGDFFDLQQQFDLVLEQTFFCALEPSLRDNYVHKMAGMLTPGGKIAGVLFNRSFEGGPPFGGSEQEYKKRFSGKFTVEKMELCYNSILPRKGSELFVIFKRSA